MSQTKKPLNEQYLRLLLAAAKAPVSLSFTRKGSAQHLRARLYSFRKQLREAKHPLATGLASIYIPQPTVHPDGLWYLDILPRNEDLEGAIDAALEGRPDPLSELGEALTALPLPEPVVEAPSSDDEEEGILDLYKGEQ